MECDDQNITSSVENSKPKKGIGMIDIVCMCAHTRVRVRERVIFCLDPCCDKGPILSYLFAYYVIYLTVFYGSH
jgi:hypothetical protein